MSVCVKDGNKSCPIEESLREIKGTVQDIHRRLFIGNGRPALTIEVDRLNQEMKQLQDAKQTQHSQRVEFWISLAALTISTVVGVIVAWKIQKG